MLSFLFEYGSCTSLLQNVPVLVSGRPLIEFPFIFQDVNLGGWAFPSVLRLTLIVYCILTRLSKNFQSSIANLPRWRTRYYSIVFAYRWKHFPPMSIMFFQPFGLKIYSATSRTVERRCSSVRTSITPPAVAFLIAPGNFMPINTGRPADIQRPAIFPISIDVAAASPIYLR